MPVSDWTQSDDWDALFFGGVRVPGVARVSVHVPSGLDVKKARGKRKAKISDDGCGPAKIEIEIELLPAELAAFEQLVPLLRPFKDSTPLNPVPLFHPQLQIWAIELCLIADIRAPHPRTGGTYTVEIDALEWVPQTAALKKAKQAPAAGYGVEDMDALMSRYTPATEEQVLMSFDDGAGLVSQE